MIKFIFDLDGTITSMETLPIIAKHFNVEEKIEALTAQTVQGNIPFIESFIRRVHILGKLPVDEICDLLAETPLYQNIYQFIQEHKDDCIIATGNVSAWVEKLIAKIGCTAYCSDGLIENNKITKLNFILRKELIVKQLQDAGHKVVFIGEGNNDLEAMRYADVSIASGLTHPPAKSVLSVADYLIFDEEALCRQLNQLYVKKNPPPAKSIVLTCAGIGSRLGLGKTKALMDVGGQTLIARQLAMFENVKDIRIVVGYQAHEVITEVLLYRKDAIFVYNHNYFETKTGTSFYLGAKDANPYVIEWDGDLLVHPDDVKMILDMEGEFICYAAPMSDEAVMVRTDDDGKVLSFSTEKGDYEWTGPACIHKDKLQYTSGHVYGMLEPHLPMKGVKIRACDVDTYKDYQRAVEFIKTW